MISSSSNVESDMQNSGAIQGFYPGWYRRTKLLGHEKDVGTLSLCRPSVLLSRMWWVVLDSKSAAGSCRLHVEVMALGLDQHMCVL